MKVGDQIQITPCIEGMGSKTVAATVVYIHPKRNYFIAEYRLHKGGPLLRESFPFAHRRGES